MVKLHVVREEVEAGVDTGAGASELGKRLAHKLSMWKTARKLTVRQGDGHSLGGNFDLNTTFKVMDSPSVLDKYVTDTAVLDIGNKDVILGSWWLAENEYSMNT